MSRAAGRSYAAFFPQAPAVVEEKKRLARERHKSSTASLDIGDGPPPSNNGSQPATADGQQNDSTSVATEVNGSPTQEDKTSQNGESSDSLNAVGSASSRTSTHSSVFSQSGNITMSTQNGAGAFAVDLTPATTHDSSPPNEGKSPRYDKSELLSHHVSGSGLEYSPISPRSTRATTPMFRPSPTTPQADSSPRPSARPGPGVVKGKILKFDPELLDRKDPRRKMPVQYKEFGQDDHLRSAPSDPRLAIPGYKSGSFNIRPSNTSGTWKFRPRPAPYNIAPYAWDNELSVGTGPPTSVVVRGYDPFTPDSQLRLFFSSYGEIAEVDNKTDPTTGVFLGVCSVKFRDSRGRGPVIAGVTAARRAEKEASGHRIGLQTIKVERDPGGKKCRRLADSVTKQNREQREKEQRLEATRKPAAPPSQPSVTSAPSASTDALAAPPPNAPRGPSGKPVEVVRQAPKMSHLIEQEPVLSRIKRKPYIFIGQEHVPVMGTTVPHLKKRLKTHHWEDIRCDDTGYYVIFEDHKRGEDECLRCYREYNKRELFTYRMIMECQQYGNPKYERSPSPERKVEIKRKHEEEERQRKEEEMDIEEEKKSRAAHMDPVTAAIEQLRIELRDKIMADIKTRIGAPALHNFLDPTRHVDKRRKLGIADPSKETRPASFLTLGGADERRRPSDDRSKPLYGASITRIQREAGKPSSNVFLDERRQNVQRKPKRQVNVKSLHQQLHDFYDEDESDDERRTTLTKDSGDRASRPASRMSSLPPSERDEQTPFTPRKKRRIERSQTPRDEESGDEDDAIVESALPPALLKKEAEELADNELALITRKLPPDHRLHKRAKAEIAARAKAQEDDRLFRDKADGTAAGNEPGLAAIEDIVQSTEIVPDAKTRKIIVKSTKRKSKKQIFEEREAAKDAAAAAKAARPKDATPEVPSVEEIEREAEEEVEIEEERAEVDWGLSTDRPRRTVEDDFNEVLDIDAWQRLVKDNEDLELLREVLTDHHPATLRDANGWACQQKAIKTLNKGKTTIDGYYVPNQSGSARTEGTKMILQSEKSKYLPHRIKVARAREEREKEANDIKSNPLVAVEAARQAKAASTATSRSNRANNRTQVKDITTAKQNLIAEGGQADTIKFNQLKKRKKLVTFNRSAIHGWGLYAEENIAANDMIIEYVGEKIRPAVAGIRELRYDKQGIGSSYLFRINDDFTVDATKKGGIARFINHSCAPNCTAKIVKVDDEDRIAIYAKCDVKAGDELTYDYKFEREEIGSDMRVPCLCGSVVCKGFLN